MPTHIANFPEVPGESEPVHLGSGVWGSFDGVNVVLRMQHGTDWHEVVIPPAAFAKLVVFGSGFDVIKDGE